MSPHNHKGILSPRLHIHLFGRKISAFHFFGAIGFIAGMSLGLILCGVLELQPRVVLLMTIISATTFFVLAMTAKSITGQENLVYYHHEVGIILCCAFCLYLVKQPLLPYLDITLLGIGTFLAFGRIGCHSVGCCHGRPHHRGIRYGQQHVDAGFTWYYKDVALLPVQLIEACFVFLIVITNIWLLSLSVPPGTVLIVYTVIYGSIRFCLEFVRGDTGRPQWMGLSEAQWTTLFLVALTYGLGSAGLLPAYKWHAALFFCMLAFSLFIIFHRPRLASLLFSDDHITQIAEGLEILDISPRERNGVVRVYTTDLGLCMSCGINDKDTRHYTLSLNNAGSLHKKMVERLAKIIGSLRYHAGSFDVIDRKNGVYHILFSLQP